MAAPTTRYEVTTPTGRMVGGDLYTPRTTDGKGRPLLYKTGKNIGQPRVDYYVALAIPKSPGVTHFSQEPGWGAFIWASGNAVGGNSATNPDFAWKIDDGDSTKPNSVGKIPNERTGYAGCWVLHLGSSQAPRIVNANGSGYLLEVGAVKRGYFVQIGLSVTFNNSPTENPGIFLNHQAISLQYAGEEIFGGPDIGSMGFGGGAMPAGALPTGSAPPPPLGAGAPPPPPPAAAPPPPPAPAAPSASVAPPPPNHTFVANAGAPVGPTMTAKANGMTRVQFVGWTDEALIAQGYMLPAAASAGAPPPPPPPPPAAAPPPPPAPAADPDLVGAPPGTRKGAAWPPGYTYASYINPQSTWTHAMMVQAGYLVA